MLTPIVRFLGGRYRLSRSANPSIAELPLAMSGLVRAVVCAAVSNERFAQDLFTERRLMLRMENVVIAHPTVCVEDVVSVPYPLNLTLRKREPISCRTIISPGWTTPRLGLSSGARAP
jgi:hypothetical protein